MNIPIYIINLKGKEENYIRLQKELSTQQMDGETQSFSNINRFQAVMGKELEYSFKQRTFEGIQNPIPVSLEAYINLTNGRVLHRSLTTKGALGCSLSHYLLWKKMVDENIDKIMILEDDAKIPSNFLNKITLLSQKKYNVISFGYSTLRGKVSEIEGENELVTNQGEFHGTQGYLINKEGAALLMKYFFPIEMQVDSYMGYMNLFLSEVPNLKSGLKMAFTKKSLVSQSFHTSSIQTSCMLCDLNDIQYDIPGKRRRILFKLMFILLCFYIVYYYSR